MRILGIDPGSRRTGWGIVDHQRAQSVYVASGTLALGEGDELSQRLLRLASGLEAIISEHRPEHCAVERIFSARNAHSALVLGHARGVILLTAARLNLALHEYAATEVKRAVVGAGRASKDQVNKMVGVLLNRREPYQEDESDALAVALTHAVFNALAEKTK